MATPSDQLERVTDDPAAIPAPPVDPRQAVRDALMATPAPAPETLALEQPSIVEPPVAETVPETPAVIVPEPEPEAPRPESHFAPFFEIAVLPDAEAIPRAVQQVQDIRAYDEDAANIAATGFYNVYEQSFFQMSMRQRGIPVDKINEFAAWVKAGANPLPAPAAPPSFPSWETRDTDGYVTLPSGVRLDPDHEASREIYEMAKYRHEKQAEELVNQSLAAKKAEEDARKAQEEARIAGERAVFDRASTFHNERVDYIESILDNASLAFGANETREELKFVSGVMTAIDLDPELDRLAKEAAPHIAKGNGRVAEYKAAIDRRIRVVVNAEIEAESRERLGRNRPAIPTAPVAVPGTQRVDVVTPPAPNTTPPKNRDEVFQRGRDAVRNLLGARPAQV